MPVRVEGLEEGDAERLDHGCGEQQPERRATVREAASVEAEQPRPQHEERRRSDAGKRRVGRQDAREGAPEAGRVAPSPQADQQRAGDARHQRRHEEHDDPYRVGGVEGGQLAESPVLADEQRRRDLVASPPRTPERAAGSAKPASTSSSRPIPA